MPEILEKPTAIFEGLRREEDEDPRGIGWLCYCGLPACDYDKKGQPIKPPENKVFLIFVNTDKMAYNWRWEVCDGEDPALPDDYANRFKRKLI